jgi:hypothetical protein
MPAAGVTRDHDDVQPRRDIPVAAGHTAPGVLLKTVIRFAGGPWHDRRGRYVHAGELTPMACPGGLYRYAQHDRDGTAVYAFDGA